MKTLFGVILLSLCFLFPLSAQTDSLRITANLYGFEEGTYLYLWTNFGGVGQKTDSAKVINKKFTISHQLQESPGVVYLSGENFDPFLRFWAENVHIRIEGDLYNFEKSTISGSKINDVAEKIQKNQENQEELLLILRNNLDKEPAINQLFFLKDKISSETLRYLYKQIPDNMLTYDYAKRIESYLSLADAHIPVIGDAMVDFQAYDGEGTNYQLSELNDRYLLLEFGSSYCGPCYMAVPELSKLQEDEEERLRIVSFSLDTRESNWRKGLEKIASREEFAHVLHIWDGKGENGTIPPQYGVNGIPVFFLFSPEGKIVDTWVGYMEGEVLEHWEAVIAAENEK